MTLFTAVLFALVVLALVYALWLRPWLKCQAWASGFFAWIEPIELRLYKKSETILVGRLLEFGGLFVTVYDSAATFVTSLDLTPLTTRALDALAIPPDMRGLAVTAFLAFLGRVITWLRAQTTKPLELVAASDANLSVAASAAVAQADAAKDQAVRLVSGS
ncbi:hypothetical protein PMI42_00695 [Bradyrhizobium sp. YR681]|uniref:hypothetical protein n=1 Tax=Bradyrhizobium sp. YR681 TaxID=1144344 RepID=UPI000270DECF|nr:hypothetical protein [Bradyrhizobium sp. YR681]EJN15678.1 hypothetical protein PMI42_00695 [Bradyrhizobium sp. YR681]